MLQHKALQGLITLEHGSGGLMTMTLIKEIILSRLKNPFLEPLDDSAELMPPEGDRIALTIDSYVVDPIFFPGGDIGSLAVNGTVNDLTMQGAVPLYLSLALILEEGLPISDLERVMDSIDKAAKRANVMIVTGDTKVVKKNEADKIFVTTSGIGVIPKGVSFSIQNARPGDLLVINGSIGDHGMAILTSREDLGIDCTIESDTAPLSLLLEHLGEQKTSIRALKDPTRGGLATTLNEIASASDVCLQIWEEALPIKEEVQRITDLLGLDPLYLANEGKLLAVVERSSAEQIVERMREHPLGRHARIIGEVLDGPKKVALLKTRIGGRRIIPVLKGIQLPRIC